MRERTARRAKPRTFQWRLLVRRSSKAEYRSPGDQGPAATGFSRYVAGHYDTTVKPDSYHLSGYSLRRTTIGSDLRFLSPVPEPFLRLCIPEKASRRATLIANKPARSYSRIYRVPGGPAFGTRRAVVLRASRGLFDFSWIISGSEHHKSSSALLRQS